MTTTAPPSGERKKRPSLAVELQEDLVPIARVIAGALGVSVTELVNTRLRPILQRELPGVLESMQAATK